MPESVKAEVAPENLDKWAISELKAARFPEGREHTYERAFVLKEFLARYKKTNNIKGKNCGGDSHKYDLRYDG